MDNDDDAEHYDLLAAIDTEMDGQVARKAIRNYDTLLREQNRIFQVLKDLSGQAVQIAAPLERIDIRGLPADAAMRRISEGCDRPENHPQSTLHSLENAAGWISNAFNISKSLSISGPPAPENTLKRIAAAKSAVHSASYVAHHWTKHKIETDGRALGRIGRSCAFCAMQNELYRISEKFEIAAKRPTYLWVPRYVQPPRHGRIRKGFLARLIAEDIAEHIDSATDYYVAMHGDNSHDLPLQPWFTEIYQCLKRISPDAIANDFLTLTKGVEYADLQFIPNLTVVRAYTVLCLNYLREVQQRMNDYAEASGQGRREPTYAFNIHNSTLNNTTVGSRVESISYSISNVINQGNQELGDALEAVKQAILKDDLGDQKRGELLDNVEYLAQAAETAPENRKAGMIRSALAALTTAATAGTQLNQALESWGSALSGIL
ncbi:hypothetical protein LTV02_04470 [Nocardia yamanashiensis]|uniref:hypothetical protein n=1 Tax=Nocardia yamanashiensis TaxID=209247 RepID=UPI001E427304|nr:hypothetical protein [Nocardia yamanashiensis]UGT42679.1 hypothetical protein LTV02_04470 [Nocardia yamanashiensis]